MFCSCVYMLNRCKGESQVKKRIIALLFTLVFAITGVIAGEAKVYAEESIQSAQDVELSEIWSEDALVGYAVLQTKGVYLLDGVSIINDAGGGKIGCGGMTTAAKKCKVSVTAIVERKVNGTWSYVTSWTVTTASGYTATASKTLSVGSGYYYRVRCLHYAGTDGSSSCTDSMWM